MAAGSDEAQLEETAVTKVDIVDLQNSIQSLKIDLSAEITTLLQPIASQLEEIQSVLQQVSNTTAMETALAAQNDIQNLKQNESWA